MNLFGFMQYNTWRFAAWSRERYFLKNSAVIGHHTSTHCTLAMWPSRCRSSQFASYSLGPMRKLRCSTFSSSRTSVAVRPSLQCALVMPITLRNIAAGTTCTSSSSMMPHSRPCSCASTRRDSSLRLPPALTMLYVVTHTHARSFGGNSSFVWLVNRTISRSVRFVHSLNCAAHWSTETEDVQRHSTLLRTRDAAAMPVSDLPAPHGSTMMPLRARPLPNILDRDFSWYGRMRVMGLSAMSKSGLRVSFRKSYSSSVGYPKLPGKHRCLTCSTCSGAISNELISRCGSYSGTPVASNVDGGGTETEAVGSSWATGRFVVVGSAARPPAPSFPAVTSASKFSSIAASVTAAAALSRSAFVTVNASAAPAPAAAPLAVGNTRAFRTTSSFRSSFKMRGSGDSRKKRFRCNTSFTLP